MITGEQARMARAALRLKTTEIADMVGVNKGTIVRIEAGSPAHPLTLRRLREVLEGAGIRFIDAEEGVTGPGVALKWGVKIASLSQGDSASTGTDDTGDLKVLDQELVNDWRNRPEKWAALSEISRQTLSITMFGDPYAADEVFRR